MDYTDFTLIAQNQDENIFVVRLGFKDNDIIYVEPDVWPENVDEFLTKHISYVFNPDPSAKAVSEVQASEEL